MNAASHTLIAENTEHVWESRPIETGKVKTRRIFKGAGVTMIRLTIDAGAVLSEHTASAPIVLQSISGTAAIDVDGKRIDMPAGAIVHIDAHVPHAVEALTPAHLLLFLLERAPSEHKPTSETPQEPTMSDVVLATNETDSSAVEAILDRHVELSGALAGYATRVIDAATAGDDSQAVEARKQLLEWCTGPLAALLDAEAAEFDPALREIDSELVDRLAGERDLVDASAQRVAEAPTAAESASAATVLRVHLGQYLRTQADRALPALAQSTTTSLATLWENVVAEIPAAGAGEAHPAAGHVCECGVVDTPELPELDVRTVPHAIRHATVFGALDAVHAGSGMILVAHHDPLPLLAQLEQRSPGRFEVSYLERGPQAWRLQLSNTGPNAG